MRTFIENLPRCGSCQNALVEGYPCGCRTSRVEPVWNAPPRRSNPNDDSDLTLPGPVVNENSWTYLPDPPKFD